MKSSNKGIFLLNSCLQYSCNHFNVQHFTILRKLVAIREQRFRAARATERVAWMTDHAEIRQISRMVRVFWHRAHIVWPSRCIFSLYTFSRRREIGSEWMHPLCRKLFTRQYVCAQNEAFKQTFLRMCAELLSFAHSSEESSVKSPSGTMTFQIFFFS